MGRVLGGGCGSGGGWGGAGREGDKVGGPVESLSEGFVGGVEVGDDGGGGGVGLPTKPGGLGPASGEGFTQLGELVVASGFAGRGAPWRRCAGPIQRGWAWPGSWWPC
jgi:hypothetical protein